MLNTYPGVLLVIMIMITLALLPYLDERRTRPDEARREELHVRRDVPPKKGDGSRR